MCTRLREAAESRRLCPQKSVYPAVCLDKPTWLEAGKDSTVEKYILGSRWMKQRQTLMSRESGLAQAAPFNE